MEEPSKPPQKPVRIGFEHHLATMGVITFCFVCVLVFVMRELKEQRRSFEITVGADEFKAEQVRKAAPPPPPKKPFTVMPGEYPRDAVMRSVVEHLKANHPDCKGFRVDESSVYTDVNNAARQYGFTSGWSARVIAELNSARREFNCLMDVVGDRISVQLVEVGGERAYLDASKNEDAGVLFTAARKQNPFAWLADQPPKSVKKTEPVPETDKPPVAKVESESAAKEDPPAVSILIHAFKAIQEYEQDRASLEIQTKTTEIKDMEAFPVLRGKRIYGVMTVFTSADKQGKRQKHSATLLVSVQEKAVKVEMYVKDEVIQFRTKDGDDYMRIFNEINREK